MKRSKDDLVLLVHGTYAARDSDVGEGWWQQGSRSWQNMKRLLPRGTQLPKRGEFFHWSGENHERARMKASNQLLEPSARQRRDTYHLCR